MFQRQNKSRQAGFIRKLDKSKRGSVELSRQQIRMSFGQSHQFSPFKDQSPQPIQKILQLHKHKLSRNTQENQCVIDYPFAKGNIQNKKKQKKQRHSNYQVNSSNLWSNVEQNRMHYKQPQNFSKKEIKKQKNQVLISMHQRDTMVDRYNTVQEIKSIKALIITESAQEIQYIDTQPQKINISLAQSFNLHCHKLKQRLQRQRVKFSKSKQKTKRQVCQSFQQTRPLKKKTSSQTNDTKIDILYERSNKPPLHPKMGKMPKPKIQIERRQSYHEMSDYNKQNCQYNSNLNKAGLNSARGSLQLNSTKFFIPSSSSRSKPITPRQAYQNSLKKWKELPQVVAKEKQREKQAQMRERISKMKAHSIQVRRKLKR